MWIENKLSYGKILLPSEIKEKEYDVIINVDNIR